MEIIQYSVIICVCLVLISLILVIFSLFKSTRDSQKHQYTVNVIATPQPPAEKLQELINTLDKGIDGKEPLQAKLRELGLEGAKATSVSAPEAEAFKDNEISALEHKLTDLNSKLKDFEKIDSYYSLLQETATEANHYEAGLEKEIVKLRESHKQKEDELQALRQEKGSLSGKLLDEEHRLKEQALVCENLLRQVKDRESEINSLKQLQRQKDEIVGKLHEEKMSMLKQLEDLKAARGALESRNKQIEALSRQLTEQRSAEEQKVSRRQAEQEIVAKEKYIHTLEAELSSLKAEKQIFETEQTILQQECRRLGAEQAQLQNMLAAKESRISELCAGIESASKQIPADEQAVSGSQLSALTQQYNELTDKYYALEKAKESQRQVFEERLASLNEKVEDLRQKNAGLLADNQVLLKQKEVEQQGLEQHLAQKDSHIDELKLKIEDLTTMITGYQELNELLTAKDEFIEQLKQKMHAADQPSLISEKEADIARLTQEINTLRDEAAKKQAGAESIQDKDEEIAVLEEENNELAEEVNVLKVQLAHANKIPQESPIDKDKDEEIKKLKEKIASFESEVQEKPAGSGPLEIQRLTPELDNQTAHLKDAHENYLRVKAELDELKSHAVLGAGEGESDEVYLMKECQMLKNEIKILKAENEHLKDLLLGK